MAESRAAGGTKTGRFPTRHGRGVRRKRIDLLHLHGYGATNFGRICALLLGIPCIVHEHIVDEHIPTVQKLADWLLARATTSAIAISKGVREFMAGPRRIPRERMGAYLHRYTSDPDEVARVADLLG